MRIGELLVQAGLVSTADVEEALVKQRNEGGRLGTKLLQLHRIEVDALSAALGKQHGVPAVFVKHFLSHDPAVTRLVPKSIAAEHMVLPIAFATAGGRRLVVCFRDPKNEELRRELEDRAGVPVIASVAPELAIQVYLGHYYDESAIVMTPMSSTDSGEIDIDVDFEDTGVYDLQVVDLDHEGVERSDPGLFLTAKLKAGSALSEAIERAAAKETPRHATPIVTLTPLSEIIERIDAASERDQASDAVMEFLRQRFEAGAFFTIKEGLALGHRGFGGKLDDDVVQSIMLPVNDDNILGLAYTSKTTWRGNPQTVVSAAQNRFFKLFASELPPVEVTVTPVLVGKRVVCLLYAHGEDGLPLSNHDVEELSKVAEATAACFGRLIRAKRNAD